MKRKWIKILTIILAVVSLVLILLLYYFACLVFDKYTNEPSYYATIFIDPNFLSELSKLLSLCLLFSQINIGCVILNTFDISKTIDENGKINFNIVLIAINYAIFILYVLYRPLILME